MAPDGSGCEPEDSGDFRVRAAFGDQIEDLAFAACQIGEIRFLLEEKRLANAMHHDASFADGNSRRFRVTRFPSLGERYPQLRRQEAFELTKRALEQVTRGRVGELDAIVPIDEDHRRLRAFMKRKRLPKAALDLASLVESSQVRPQRIRDPAVALTEIPTPVTAEDEDLRVRRGPVEAHAHLVVEPVGTVVVDVELTPLPLGLADEVGETVRAEVASHVLVMADRMLIMEPPGGVEILVFLV